MARHQFTLQEKISGAKAALRSKYTPPQLKPSLRRYLDRLQGSSRRKKA